MGSIDNNDVSSVVQIFYVNLRLLFDFNEVEIREHSYDVSGIIK